MHGIFDRQSQVLEPLAAFTIPICHQSQNAHHWPTTQTKGFLTKAIVYFFGLAVSIASLSVSRLFEWWNHSQNDFITTSEPGPFDRSIESTMVLQRQTRVSDNGSMDPRWSPCSTSSHEVQFARPFAQSDFERINSALNPEKCVLSGHEKWIPPLILLGRSTVSWNEINIYSPFSWTNASLNCSHFYNGVAQLCLICWLNSRDGWVFGPCLKLPSRCFSMWLDDSVARLASTEVSGSTLSYRSLGLRFVLALMAFMCDRLVPRPSHASYHIDSGLTSESLIKLPRSAGDGAPSVCSTDTEINSPTKSKHRSNNRGSPLCPTTHCAYSSPASDKPTLFSSQRPWNGDFARQAQVSVPSSPSVRRNFSDGILGQPSRTSPYPAYLHSVLSNCLSSSVEYEDDLQFDDSDLLGDTWQLPTKHDRNCLKDSALPDAIEDVFFESHRTKSIDDVASSSTMNSPRSPAVTRRRKRLQQNFADLAQKATDLTGDLLCLEDVLHQFHYRMQAAQIELAQTEDRLDYAWHLRDNLEGSCSESSYQSSCASQPESLGASMSPPVIRLTLDETSDRCSTRSDNPECQPGSSAQSGRPTSSPNSVVAMPTHESPVVMLLTRPESESGIGQSLSMSSSVISSMPDSTMPTRRHTNVRSRPTASKRHREHFRRFTMPSSMLDVVHPMAADEPDTLASDGFVYPELSFDNDGIIDWMVTAASVKSDALLEPAELAGR